MDGAWSACMIESSRDAQGFSFMPMQIWLIVRDDLSVDESSSFCLAACFMLFRILKDEVSRELGSATDLCRLLHAIDLPSCHVPRHLPQ